MSEAGLPSVAAPDKDTSREALMHFVTAYAFLGGGLVAWVWNSGRLAQGAFGDARVLGGLHLLTLGWLTLSIFGALRVFTGVALGRSGGGGARTQWMARGIRPLWTLGAITFPAGLLLGAPALILAGASVLGAGLLLFSLHILPALAKASRGGLTRAYLTIAVVSLWGTWLLGGAAACVRAGHPLGRLPEGYLSAHVLLAVFGWVGATVVGVGSHLIPMFALSRDPSQWPAKAALPFWAAVPVCAAVGAFRPELSLQAGWVCAGIGSLLWLAQVAIYFRTRLRRERDPGLFLAAGATLFMGLAWVIGVSMRAPVAFVGLIVVGWLTLFTLGIYHRVIPFLVWFARFARRAGHGPLPKVRDLIDERLGMATAVLALVGVALWGAGLLVGQSVLAYSGSALVLAGYLLSLGQLKTLLAEHRERSPQVMKDPKIGEVVRKLETVIDPEVGINIVDLGLIHGLQAHDGVVEVKMTLTTRGCPMGSWMCREVGETVGTLAGVREVRVSLVWNPPWSPACIKPGAIDALPAGRPA